MFTDGRLIYTYVDRGSKRSLTVATGMDGNKGKKDESQAHRTGMTPFSQKCLLGNCFAKIVRGQEPFCPPSPNLPHYRWPCGDIP